ncbi:uncharacterized protein UV8b_08178 [Ustilaginoidea virens]|uniref:Uncharacterized protein n=1 Tax=Ustilaginoidea virens TaxID=1159556 RepID=A0A8E5HYQ6_USTVR|nr:uncharacterized protein UV8b_08178 [Ustilaginoidea virens]QUC23937.1 hypothetical protein UV8b_08178 [Ustilaginoidea virens]
MRSGLLDDVDALHPPSLRGVVCGQASSKPKVCNLLSRCSISCPHPTLSEDCSQPSHEMGPVARSTLDPGGSSGKDPRAPERRAREPQRPPSS